jgi:hypothetical protein
MPGHTGGMPDRLRRERFSRSVARDFGTHRRPNCEMLHCDYCVAFVSEVAMIDVVDRILSTYRGAELSIAGVSGHIRVAHMEIA